MSLSVEVQLRKTKASLTAEVQMKKTMFECWRGFAACWIDNVWVLKKTCLSVEEAFHLSMKVQENRSSTYFHLSDWADFLRWSKKICFAISEALGSFVWDLKVNWGLLFSITLKDFRYVQVYGREDMVMSLSVELQLKETSLSAELLDQKNKVWVLKWLLKFVGCITSNHTWPNHTWHNRKSQ